MCSKMSQLHAQLEEQAAELGYEGLEGATHHGWEVDYYAGELKSPDGTDDDPDEEDIDPEKAQTLAHLQWLATKQATLAELYTLYSHFMKYDETYYAMPIRKAISFIEGVRSE